MGIRTLTSCIEKNCPGGSISVNISDITEKTIRESGRNEATLAIDTTSCGSRWYWQSTHNGYCGGQWKEFKMELQNIITDCKKLKLNLIFFFDGYARKYELRRRNEWHIQQEEKLRGVENVFSWLDKEGTCEDIVKETNTNTMPQTTLYFAKYILSSLGQTVICADGDANYDIMKYAVETPECIGVLSNDSDFLGYLGGKPVFTLDDFKPEENKAKMWHKPALLKRLGLEEEDIPVLACLLGNSRTKDYADELQKLKWSQKGNWTLSISEKLSHFKSSKGHNLQLLQDQILPNCREFIFSMVVDSYILPNTRSPWIQKGNSQFGYNFTKANKFVCSEQLLEEVRFRSPWIYNLFRCGIVLALPSYECGIFEPQFVLYRFIRERLYGIIFCEIISENPVVEEWIGYTHKREIELRHPVPLTFNRAHVTLHKLWEPDYPRNNKIHIFEQCMGLIGHYDCLNEVVPNFPEYLIVSSYLLSYMAQNMTNLTQYDLKCLIECTIWCNDVSNSFLEELPSQVKPKAKAAEIAAHYVRGLQMLLRANVVCGEPFSRDSFMPTSTIDGMLFQAIYQNPEKFSYQDPMSFRNILMDLCSKNNPTKGAINYLQKLNYDMETLSLRPQRKVNFKRN